MNDRRFNRFLGYKRSILVLLKFKFPRHSILPHLRLRRKSWALVSLWSIKTSTLWLWTVWPSSMAIVYASFSALYRDRICCSLQWSSNWCDNSSPRSPHFYLHSLLDFSYTSFVEELTRNARYMGELYPSLDDLALNGIDHKSLFLEMTFCIKYMSTFQIKVYLQNTYWHLYKTITIIVRNSCFPFSSLLCWTYHSSSSSQNDGFL